MLALAPQLPDVSRELNAAGAVSGQMHRLVQGPTGSLLPANAFPFVEQRDARLPFTFLVLALASVVVGLARMTAACGGWRSAARSSGSRSASPPPRFRPRVRRTRRRSPGPCATRPRRSR
ncbi:MAG: hypothetical protein A3F70_07700 [Acidobacteria bacterium RIFCSPLOWO2_12_FULL_67_14]|nr:MAG: hypothetical protein A3F70_07700 [Acidobacteria bacterium RIFCSPLOWO2_12_FULL_67_14]